jgi:antirestriction protein
MWQNEVLEEIQKVREEHAKSFNYDLEAICADLRKQESNSERQILSKPLKPRDRAPITQS